MRRADLAAAAGLILAAAGCAGGPLQGARDDFYRRDYAKAEERLKPLSAEAGSSAVLVAMERGTILQAQGSLEPSSEAYLHAIARIRELETKSLTREVAALGYSDIAKEYVGELHERTLLHAYLMADFLLMGRFDGALVEARRSVEILDAPEHPRFAEDPFTRFLSALAFDIRGDLDDAYIELRKAADLAPQCPYLKAPLLRIAGATGRSGDLSRWHALPGAAEDFAPGGGVLIALVGTGRSPVKIQKELFFPPSFRFVVPAYKTRPCETSGAVLLAGAASARCHPLTDVAKLAHAVLDDRIKREVAKEVARQGGSAVVAHAIEQRQGSTAADLWRVAWAMARTVDRRSWQTLPEKLQVAVLPLPAGRHEAVLRFEGPGAQKNPEVRLKDVEIRAGRYTFVAARGF